MSSVKSSPPILSRQFALVVSAGIDLLWRIPGDLLAPLLSLLSGLVGSQTTASATSWMMFSVALYTFAHLAYPQGALPKEKRGFRTGFTIGTLPFAYIMHTDPPVGVIFLTGLGTIIYAGAIMLMYLHLSQGWSVLDAEGQAVTLVEFVFPHEDEVREEIRTDLARTGFLGAVGTILYLIATIMLLAIPCVLAAIGVVILFDTYPIPDVLFLGWGISAYVFPRISRGPSQSWIDDRRMDFEESLIDSVENATRSLLGLALSLYILSGLFGFGLSMYYGIRLSPDLLQPVLLILTHPMNVPPKSILLAWDMLGVAILLLVSATFGTWAWMREFRRLPHFLDYWEGREMAAQDIVARPPGFVLPALLSILLTRWYVYTASARNLVFALLWPLAVVGLLWAIYRTRVSDPQPVKHENLVITGWLVAETFTFWSLGFQEPFATFVRGKTDIVRVFALPALLSGLIFLLSVLPMLNRWGSQSGPYRRVAGPVVIVLVGIASGVSLPLIPQGYQTTITTLSIFSVVVGLFWSVVRWYDI